MAGICFYYEDPDVDVWSGHDLDAWNYACKVAGDIDKAIVINKTSKTLDSMDSGMEFSVVPDMEAAQALMTGNMCCLVCPWDVGTHQSIAGYDHSADWYVFGPAAGWHDSGLTGYYIPQAGTGAVHSVHAATVVMFHRYWTLNL